VANSRDTKGERGEAPDITGGGLSKGEELKEKEKGVV